MVGGGLYLCCILVDVCILHIHVERAAIKCGVRLSRMRRNGRPVHERGVCVSVCAACNSLAVGVQALWGEATGGALAHTPT